MGGGIVVVMAERDKEEMESDIAKMEFDFRQTSVICRSGSPLILADLKKVHIHWCNLFYHIRFLINVSKRLSVLMNLYTGSTFVTNSIR